MAAALLAGPLWAAAPNDDVKSRINGGLSLAPIVGYDPAYGVLVGGAVFRGVLAAPYSNASAIAYASFKKNAALELRYKIWDRDRWFYNFESTLANFFDPYYGEGDRTDVNGRIMIDNFHASFDPSVGYRFDRQLTLILGAQLRYRDETGVRVFGSELRPAYGATLVYDNRDNQIDTHHGIYTSVALDTGPGAFSTKAGAKNFARAAIDLRGFTEAFPWLVLAAQIRAGTIAGDAGYQFRFALGGSDSIRGYPSNRFRGDVFYLTQVEGRFILMRWLSLALFTAAADIADRTGADFRGPLLASGFGLRIGLPPDYVAKARLDFGFANDQQSIYLSFNEAF